MLTRSMAAEWAKHNIQANAIGPGYILTEMNTALIENAEFDAWVRSSNQTGRWANRTNSPAPRSWLRMPPTTSTDKSSTSTTAAGCRYFKPARPQYQGSERRPQQGSPGHLAMKITRLSTYRVPPRWMFLKIETDEGLSGWGEPVLEGRARTVEGGCPQALGLSDRPGSRADQRSLANTLSRRFLSRRPDPLMSAIAGIDQALWDIRARYLACRFMSCWADSSATG